jgi:hypothetical protein
MPGYLGNKFGMVVHHLAVMVPKCEIYDIKKEDSVYFVPDMLEQARKEGFVPCKHCVDKLPKLGMEVLKINGAML